MQVDPQDPAPPAQPPQPAPPSQLAQAIPASPSVFRGLPNSSLLAGVERTDSTRHLRGGG